MIVLHFADIDDLANQLRGRQEDLVSWEKFTTEYPPDFSEEYRLRARRIVASHGAIPSAQADRGKPVAWLIEWTHRLEPGTSKPGGGSEIIRNQYAAVEERVQQLKQLVWMDTVVVTPLAPTLSPGVSPERIEGAGEDNPFTFDFVQALSKATFDQKFGLNAWRDTNDDVRRVWINQTQDVIQTARLEADLSARGGA